MPWRQEWQPTPVFLPGQFHGQGSLVGYSPWGLQELDMTEWLTLSFFQQSLCPGHFLWFYPIHHPRNLDSSVTRKENHSNGEFSSTKVFLVCPHISTLSPAWRKAVRMCQNWTQSYSQHRYQHVPRTTYHEEGVQYWCTEHNTLSKVFTQFVTI